MPTTTYAPTGTLTAGNLKLLIGAPIANLAAPAIAAFSASGFEVQCAMEAFGSTTSVSTAERRKLCDKESKTRISNRQRGLDPITFTGDKTASTALLAMLTEDAKIGIIARPYDAHSGALAAGDKVWAFNATVASVDPAPISTTEGEEFAFTVAFSEVTRNLNAAVVA